MVTTKSADSVLKSYYLDVVSDQLDLAANPLLAQIQKTTSDVWGKDVRKLVRYGINGALNAIPETGSLPPAKGNHYAQFVSTLKNLYGTIEVTDKAIRASANNEGAFVSLLNDEMDGLIKSATYNFGRMLFGDGTGKLCTVLSVEGDDIYCDSVKNLEIGMMVNMYTPEGSFVKTGNIKSVDRVKKCFNIEENTPGSMGIGTYVYNQSSMGNEITGLDAIFNAPTLYGLDRESNPWMKPVIKTAVGEITESILQKTLDEVEEKTGGKINFIVCSWGVRRALIEALSAYRSLEPMELTGGFRALSYNGIPIVADRFCPDGTMYLLNTDDFALHQLCDWEWLEGENGKILERMAGKAIYTATLVKYAELMCYRPAGQAMLTGITEK